MRRTRLLRFVFVAGFAGSMLGGCATTGAAEGKPNALPARCVQEASSRTPSGERGDALTEVSGPDTNEPLQLGVLDACISAVLDAVTQARELDEARALAASYVNDAPECKKDHLQFQIQTQWGDPQTRHMQFQIQMQLGDPERTQRQGQVNFRVLTQPPQ